MRTFDWVFISTMQIATLVYVVPSNLTAATIAFGAVVAAVIMEVWKGE